MNNITEFMAADHRRLDSIFLKFRNMKTSDIDKAKRLFQDFMQGLQRHIVWEEKILFPVFEEKTGMRDGGPVFVMRMEHRHIREYLEQIHRKISAEDMQDIDAQEDGLFAVLSGHNHKEENMLYPCIDRETNEQERKDIISRMRDHTPEQQVRDTGHDQDQTGL